jgi:hypothetical protein
MLKKTGFLIIGSALLLHAYTAFIKSEGGTTPFSIGLMLWSWLPYLLSAWFFSLMRRPLVPLCGVIPPLIIDAWTFYAVFIRPQSSTAALALIWVPLWNLVIFMPLGMLIGWILSRFLRPKLPV